MTVLEKISLETMVFMSYKNWAASQRRPKKTYYFFLL